MKPDPLEGIFPDPTQACVWCHGNGFKKIAGPDGEPEFDECQRCDGKGWILKAQEEEG
jgi:DnaJ-class molecular chaperone